MSTCHSMRGEEGYVMPFGWMGGATFATQVRGGRGPVGQRAGLWRAVHICRDCLGGREGRP